MWWPSVRARAERARIMVCASGAWRGSSSSIRIVFLTVKRGKKGLNGGGRGFLRGFKGWIPYSDANYPRD